VGSVARRLGWSYPQKRAEHKENGSAARVRSLENPPYYPPRGRLRWAFHHRCTRLVAQSLSSLFTRPLSH
jgi:hypothetical protein